MLWCSSFFCTLTERSIWIYVHLRFYWTLSFEISHLFIVFFTWDENTLLNFCYSFECFCFSSKDDADAYRDRLKVLRMRAGLDNQSNTASKVCRRISLYCTAFGTVRWHYVLHCVSLFRKRNQETSVYQSTRNRPLTNDHWVQLIRNHPT